MRDATTNPFEPGSDRVPQVWAGRHAQLADWRDRLRPRRLGGQGERGRTFLGDPGIGKSVLVRRIAALAAQEGDLVTEQVRVPRGVDPLPLLGRALLQVAERAGLPDSRDVAIEAVLRRVRGLTVGGVGVQLDRGDGPPPHVALQDLLVALGRAALRDGRVLVVHVDEVQNVEDDAALSQLLVALGDALSHDEEVTAPSGQRLVVALPIAVYLTGLPEFHDRASSRTGATFARRFQTTLLAPLEDDDVRGALRPFVHVGWPVVDEGGEHRVTMTQQAVEAVVQRCHGDPFLFQLAGQHAWDAGDGAVIDDDDVRAGWQRARGEAVTHVERLLGRLPELERALLETMAAMPPEDRTATAIARALGYERASQIGPTAQRLDTVRGILARGKPYSFRVRAVEAYLGGDWP